MGAKESEILYCDNMFEDHSMNVAQMSERQLDKAVFIAE